MTLISTSLNLSGGCSLQVSHTYHSWKVFHFVFFNKAYNAANPFSPYYKDIPLIPLPRIFAISLSLSVLSAFPPSGYSLYPLFLLFFLLFSVLFFSFHLPVWSLFSFLLACLKWWWVGFLFLGHCLEWLVSWLAHISLAFGDLSRNVQNSSQRVTQPPKPTPTLRWRWRRQWRWRWRWRCQWQRQKRQRHWQRRQQRWRRRRWRGQAMVAATPPEKKTIVQR